MKQKNGIHWFLTLLVLVLGFGTQTQARIEVGYHVLDNGLKVILYESRHAPVISCRIFYTTGSVHEAAGRSGIAHLLEHMLFKGTKKVGVTDSVKDAQFILRIDSLRAVMRQSEIDSTRKISLQNQYDSLLSEHRKLFIKDELWEAYLKAGGTGLNAFTSDLITSYYVTLPRNRLELFLWLESDRMKNGVLREFYPERDVVREERRMRVEDRPTGRYWESLMGVFYEAHPYRIPTIGYESDIEHLSRQQAEEHYEKYYKPNNCILILAGDFKSEDALQQIKRYFGSIPKGAVHAPIVTREPKPAGEKRLTVRRNDAKPRYDLLFHTPGVPHDDLYALDILEGALSGKSGRLHKKLVKDLKIATSVSAGNYVNKYTSYFRISVALGPNPRLAEVEKAVWEVLNDLKREKITDRELARVSNQVLARTARELKNIDDLATTLAFWELYGSWNMINTFPENVRKVGVDKVLSVSKKYFHPQHSTVGVVLPDPETNEVAAKGKQP